MKCYFYLSLLPSADLAFQQAGTTPLLHQTRTTALRIFPENFDKMEEIADGLLFPYMGFHTELDHFQSHLGGAGGEFRSEEPVKAVTDHYKDTKTKMASDMLEKRSELLHTIEEYLPAKAEMNHDKDTKMVSEILHKQSELMKMMSDYIGGHQPDTFDMSNV